ncbi:Uncharacterized protein Fot_12472 [Forsythia ovata]|uniref:Uncharacterized protein n=1 Tax=Forsythia ovata TaxID=205694 RepID=A0ABD1WMS3_9LAMI
MTNIPLFSKPPYEIESVPDLVVSQTTTRNKSLELKQVTGSKLWRQVGESFHPPKLFWSMKGIRDQVASLNSQLLPSLKLLLLTMREIGFTMIIGNALLDMYAKCCCLAMKMSARLQQPKTTHSDFGGKEKRKKTATEKKSYYQTHPSRRGVVATGKAEHLSDIHASHFLFSYGYGI